MTSHYLPPIVEGVNAGKLDIDVTPNPSVTVKHIPIDRPHTISVMWEIFGSDQWVYCCVLQKRSGTEFSPIVVKPWDEYTAIRSGNSTIRVRYSVSTQGGALEYSESSIFEAVSAAGQPPGSSLSDVAVREAVAHYGSGHWIYGVDLKTESVGEYATVFATWSTMGSKERCLTWGKEGDENYLWRSEYKKAEVDADNKLSPVIFEVPTRELLKLDRRYGALSLRAEEGSIVTPHSVLASVNYVEAEGKRTAWPSKSGVVKLTPDS